MLKGGRTFAVVGLGVLLLSGCDPSSATPENRSPSVEARAPTMTRVPRPEVAGLQELAESACGCARSSREGSSCWDEFQAGVAGLQESTSSATACAPVSTELRCFEEDAPDGGFCIVTGYALVVGDAPRLCSEREAQIVEATYQAALDGTGDDYDQASAAAERAAIALARGDDVPMPAAALDCTG